MTEPAPETRIVHRTVVPRDLPFIANSWLRSARRRGFKYIDPRVYFYWHHRMIEALIPTSNVIVACDSENPDRIYGWGCATDASPLLVIHFLYARDGWRRMGIGASILRAWLERFEPKQVAWTHTSEQWERFIKKMVRDDVLTVPGIFNPYLGYRQWVAAELAQERRP